MAKKKYWTRTYIIVADYRLPQGASDNHRAHPNGRTWKTRKKKITTAKRYERLTAQAYSLAFCFSSVFFCSITIISLSDKNGSDYKKYRFIFCTLVFIASPFFPRLSLTLPLSCTHSFHSFLFRNTKYSHKDFNVPYLLLRSKDRT